MRGVAWSEMMRIQALAFALLVVIWFSSAFWFFTTFGVSK